MKKNKFILENTYTIPLNSEVLYEFYSNLDYLLTSDEIYIATNTRKGIEVKVISLPFCSKNIEERCKSNIIFVDNTIRYKFITIHYNDIVENQTPVSSDENLSFSKPEVFEKKFINKNYLLVFGRLIGLYDPKSLNVLYQCQPLSSNQQSYLPLLYTTVASFKSYIVIGSTAGHLILGQIRNNKIDILQITNNLCIPIIDISINKDGIIAVAYDDGQIYIYKLENTLLNLISTSFNDDCPNAIITQIQIGDYLLVSYSNGQIRLFSYDNKRIKLQCEVDIGYSEIKGIDYWNNQNMFTVIVDDVIYIYKIIEEDEKGKKEVLLHRKIKTTSDLTAMDLIDYNSGGGEEKEKVASENMLNVNLTVSIDDSENKNINNKKNFISNDDVNYEDSLSLIMQWSYQCNSKYLNGVKFLRHLNCDDFNTDDKHNYKYVAVVAYDFSEIDIYSISYR